MVLKHSQMFYFQLVQRNFAPYELRRSDSLKVTIRHSTTGSAVAHLVEPAPPTNHSKLRLSFTTRLAGTHSLHVQLNGRSLAGTPLNRSFLPGARAYKAQRVFTPQLVPTHHSQRRDLECVEGVPGLPEVSTGPPASPATPLSSQDQLHCRQFLAQREEASGVRLGEVPAGMEPGQRGCSGRGLRSHPAREHMCMCKCLERNTSIMHVLMYAWHKLTVCAIV